MTEVLFEKEFLVTEDHSAQHWGSGALEVLSTPALIAFIENTAFEFVEGRLSDQETTVGAYIDIAHLAPTKINRLVQVKVIGLKVDGKIYDFDLEAYEGDKLIARSHHKRAVINIDKFIHRLG